MFSGRCVFHLCQVLLVASCHKQSVKIRKLDAIHMQLAPHNNWTFHCETIVGVYMLSHVQYTATNQQSSSSAGSVIPL